jgi:hypothetical protein
MKRIGIYIVIMAILLLVPIKGADMGKLRPIEVVFVYRSGEQIVLETDMGDRGVGATGADALQNLKDTNSYLLQNNKQVTLKVPTLVQFLQLMKTLVLFA